MNGEQISQSIAYEWDDIRGALGPSIGVFEEKLLPLLRTLEQNPADTVAATAILNLFAEYPAARNALQRGLDQVGAHLTKAAGVALLEQRYRYISVPVYFGTCRQRTGSSKTAEFFAAERGNDDFGVAEVSIPDDHRMGELEKPSWWRLAFSKNPEKHVVLLNVEPLERDRFVQRARERIAAAEKKEVLIFVHGFNVSFADATRRAAQLAYDLNFQGLPAVYSWPSEGKVVKYLVDANNATWAQPHFADFLKLIREQLGADVVHVIAHSMGNRLLAGVLASNSFTPTAQAARLRQVIFAAPDIDADTFRELAKEFPGKAERITLYASLRDNALAVSQSIQKYARAGQAGSDLVVVESIDTIDATSVETDFLNHSYFGDSKTVVSDLFYLVRNGIAPSDRARLRPQMRYGNRYWILAP